MVILMLKQSQSGTSKIEATFLLLLILVLFFLLLTHPHATSFTLSGVWSDPASVRHVTSTTSTCPLVHGPQFEENDKGSNFQYYVFAFCKGTILRP